MKANRKYNTNPTPSGLIFTLRTLTTGCAGGYSYLAPSEQNKLGMHNLIETNHRIEPVLKGQNMNNRG